MRLLIPHEHGAYGQLGFPILTALAAGRPTLAAALLVVACAAAFVAHEPVLVLLGQRGPRAARELAGAARHTLWWSLGTASLTGIGATLWLPMDRRWTIALPAALALVALPLILRRAQKSVAGELHIALTLSSCAVPVGVASGLSLLEAMSCAAVFAMGFGGATLGVRASIAAQRRESTLMLRIGTVFVAVAAPLMVWAAPQWMPVSPRAWLAALPLAALAVALATSLPSARHLRTVGWSLTTAALMAGLALVLVLRG